jgi:hypothetical protein
MKVPDITPPATLHTGLEMRPPSVEEMAQPVSAVLKPEPVIRTVVPTRPTVGNNEIAAVTVNVVVAKSPRPPMITIVLTPEAAVASTVKEAVTVPSIPIWHVNGGAAAMRLTGVPGKNVHGLTAASPTAKPEPVMDTAKPRGPAFGVGVIMWGTMFSVALAETVPSVKVIVSLRPANITSTMNCAAAVRA